MATAKAKTAAKKILITQELASKSGMAILRAASRIPALKRYGPKSRWHMSVRLVSQTEMKRLNQLHLGKAYATDVLSFPAPSIFAPFGYLGDLVLCLPVLKRQAKELNHTDLQELQVLLVHGVLHLLGMDHEKSRAEARRMSEWEKVLLKKAPGLIRRTSGR
jgi:probable rRNA maturation factor